MLGPSATSWETLLDQVTRGDVDDLEVAHATDEQLQYQYMVAEYRFEPEELKVEVVSLLRCRPQLLSCFEPDFAEGVIRRLAA